MTASEWITLLSPVANLILVAFVVPSITQAKNTQTQLAVLRYQVSLLMQRNGIAVPEETLPTGL